ncbi:hypothetical protein GOBAR_AA04924 [Gossypium barbadense]|uniref:Uncharacterized protein n=1 Tax=Gossypium barbadense TaxID=3634 RepID=A0A2P5YJ89_GOSBA|nr:hypothetical protein GOBAR_AA04924 [Gossypium barbadense]
MSTEEEYYINLYVGCKSVRDPYVRYLGGEMVKLKEDLDTTMYFELSTVEGAGDGNECVEVAGSKGDKGVEVAGNKDGEGGEGLGEKGVEVVGIKCGNGGEVEGGEGLNGKSAEIAGDKGSKYNPSNRA